MAVDSLATTAAKILERSNVYEVYKEIPTIPTVSSKYSTEDQRKETTASNRIKKAKLRRERSEVVKHLYNVMDTVRQTNYQDSAAPSDSESLGGLDSDDEFLDLYDHDLKYHRRKQTISRQTKRERLPSSKEKRFIDFCRERETANDITLERSRKAIKVKFDKCTKQISRNNNCREQNLERKANIEKRLRKLGLKRNKPQPLLEENTRTTSVNRDHPATEKFALRGGNVPKEMQDMVTFLLSLQFRDVTPEDYEFLLRLDESVPTKTVSEKRLASLTEDEAGEEHASNICSVCMESYELGQTRKTLPCGHVFHSNCIDTWLRESSTKCPLDGWEI